MRFCVANPCKRLLSIRLRKETGNGTRRHEAWLVQKFTGHLQGRWRRSKICQASKRGCDVKSRPRKVLSAPAQFSLQ
jgi:hypothetical protein